MPCGSLRSSFRVPDLGPDIRANFCSINDCRMRLCPKCVRSRGRYAWAGSGGEGLPLELLSAMDSPRPRQGHSSWQVARVGNGRRTGHPTLLGRWSNTPTCPYATLCFMRLRNGTQPKNRNDLPDGHLSDMSNVVSRHVATRKLQVCWNRSRSCSP
jgi:hypothetical protein